MVRVWLSMGEDLLGFVFCSAGSCYTFESRVANLWVKESSFVLYHLRVCKQGYQAYH